MKKQITDWQKECEAFQQWFANLGGNIANNEQMSEAFARIQAKGKSDNKLFEILEEDKINNIEVCDHEEIGNNFAIGVFILCAIIFFGTILIINK